MDRLGQGLSRATLLRVDAVRDDTLRGGGAEAEAWVAEAVAEAWMAGMPAASAALVHPSVVA